MTAPLDHQLIRASAGAGKTYELTSRYIDLLRQGAQPRDILATTFTRKAAGEILERLLSRLAQQAATDSESRQLLAMVCRSLHTVAVSTIDSFFGRMASCFHYELDLPANARMIGENDAAAIQLRAQAIDAMLADEDLHVLLDLMQRLYHDSAQRGVTEFIDQQVVSLYDMYREAPDAQVWSQLAVPQQLDKDNLATACDLLSALLPDAEKKYGKPFAKSLLKAQDQAEHSDWTGLIKDGLCGKLAAGESTFSRKPIPDEVIAALHPLVIHAKAYLIGEVARRTKAMHSLIQRFDKHYTQLREQHHLLLYADLPHRLAQRMNMDDALRLQVYYRLDRRVSHLLLDEFQDTSVQQWDILRPFAQEITSTQDRTIFCVGDTKQAIYGWRGGCAEIFDQLEDDLFLPPESIISRNKSYRSSQIVLDSINKVFTNLANLPSLNDHASTAKLWQQRFELHMANDPDKRGYTELVTSLPEDHVYFVANRIEELAMQSPSQNIGVLVGSNARAAELIDLLQRRAVVLVSGEGGSPVTDDPAVLAVLAAVTLADHPGNTAQAYHVANSPLGPIIGLMSAEKNHVNQIALLLRAMLLDQGYAQTISDWAKALAPQCDRRSVTRLMQLVELADRYDPDLTLRPSAFVAFVRATVVEEPSPARVRVMTVHKAKGLEFDIVVLAHLEKMIGQVSHDSLCVMRDEPTSPVRAVYASSNKQVRSLCPPLEQAYDCEVVRRLNDDLCAIYVAMTRAKHALHMIVPPLTMNTKGSANKLKLSYASILRDALSNVEEHFDGDQTLFRSGDEGWFIDKAPLDKPLLPPPAEVLHINLPVADQAARSWQRVTPSTHTKTAMSLLEISSSDGRTFGSVIHGWFELIEYLPATLPDDHVLMAKARQITTHVPGDWLTTFKAMLDKPAVIEALTKPAGDIELWRERAFAVKINNQLVRGIFDRVTITPRGVDLIDFKTDARVDEYRPQLKSYRAALATMLNVAEDTIRTRLLQVSTGQCVEV